MIKSKFFLDDDVKEVIKDIEKPKNESPKEEVKTTSNPDMKYCKHCGTENLKRVKYCGNCGKSEFYDTYEEYDELTNYKYCYKCEKKLKASIKFCPDCGSDKFMTTLQEVKLAKENSIHDEWKAKVDKSRKSVEDAQKEYESLCARKEEIIGKTAQKRYEYKRIEDSNNDEIVRINEENKHKAYKFNKSMNDLKDRISYLKSQLSVYEKEIASNKEELKKLDKTITDLQYELSNLENQISDALYRMRDAQRKAMTDYFNKCFPKKEQKVVNKIETLKHEPYSPSYPFVHFGTFAGKSIKWRVLDISNDEVLLLSDIIICSVSPKELSVSYLDNFMSSFTAEEKKYMLRKIKLVENMPDFTHYVGVLTYKDALKYLKNKESRMADYDKENCKVINLYSGRASWLVDGGSKRINGTGGPGDILFPGEKHGFRPVIKIKKTYLDNAAQVATSKNEVKSPVDDFISQTFTVEKDGDNLTIARFNVAAKNVIIPSSVIKIKEYAFKNSSAEYINHLLIPGSIKNIDDSIFSKCKGLYNLVIEDGIKSIGHYSFHYADVRYLYIPDSVKKIGNEAFHWMLEAVSIPKDCTLGNKSFPESTLVIRRK